MSTTSLFLRRGGTAGLALFALGLSCNSTPENKPPVTGCTIDGTDYADNTVNPNDPCQSCQLSVSATSWSSLQDGQKCNQGNSVCTNGACRPGCFIGGMFYAAPDLDPANSCQICHPGETTTDWTNLPEGSACADGGICTGGNCQVGCYILGKVYPDRSDNPADLTLCCNKSSDSNGWSNRLLGPTTYDLGATGADIVAADFNGDGVADLAAVDLTHSWVSLLLSDGQGGFLALQTFPTDSAPRAIVAADLNGDGKPDLLVKSKKAIDVLLNQGGGAFGAKVVYPAGTGVPGSMSAGDLDGDGNVDLICSEYEDGLMYFPGLGNGTLSAGLSLTDAGEGPIASADLNADSAIDLLTADPDGGLLGLLGGIGDGGVFPPQFYPPSSGPEQVLIADVNGDGIPDLVLSTAVDVQILFGQGMGSFNVPVIFQVATKPGGFGFGDLNGSGHGALLVSSGGVGELATLTLPDGGTVQSVVILAPLTGTTARLAVGDFNGDHAPDVAILSGTGISVFLNGCP